MLPFVNHRTLRESKNILRGLSLSKHRYFLPKRERQKKKERKEKLKDRHRTSDV